MAHNLALADVACNTLQPFAADAGVRLTFGRPSEKLIRPGEASVRKTVIVRDEASGKVVELPVVQGTEGEPTINIKELPKELGYFTYDPGFTATASCTSAITFIDGGQGILRHRGYPIEQLAEQSTFLEVAYLLLNGELPEPAANLTCLRATSPTTRWCTRSSIPSSRASITTPTRWP